MGSYVISYYSYCIYDNLKRTADALLTPLGETQASEARNVWQEERIAGLPAPDAIYCSPLTRALRTCEITFSGVVSFKERQPVILEVVRIVTPRLFLLELNYFNRTVGKCMEIIHATSAELYRISTQTFRIS